MDIRSVRREHCPAVKWAVMSTIDDVRRAEERVQRILDALRKTTALDPSRLSDELKKATEDYARAVRELKSP